MGKMARQQKYQKAHSDTLKGLLTRQRTGDASRHEAASARLKSVSSPNTRSKNWITTDDDPVYDADQKNSRMFDAGHRGII
jgi:hypothetical protein